MRLSRFFYRCSFFFFFLIFLSSCTLKNETKIQISGFQLSQRDLEFRSRVAWVFYPKDTTENVGKIQLIQAYTKAAILEKSGQKIGIEVAKIEDHRINEFTRDPIKLGEIKSIFKTPSGGFDFDAYVRNFLIPSYVDRVFESEFFRSHAVHEKIHLSVESLHEELLNKFPTISEDQFFKIAREKLELAPQLGEFCICRDAGPVFTELFPGQKKKVEKQKIDSKVPVLIDRSSSDNQQMREKVEKEVQLIEKNNLDRWFTDMVRPTKVSEVVKSLIDNGDHYLILRMKQKSKKSACFSALRIKKINFSDWFAAEKKKVVIIEN